MLSPYLLKSPTYQMFWLSRDDETEEKDRMVKPEQRRAADALHWRHHPGQSPPYLLQNITIMFTQELLVADKEGKDVNLNKTKTRLSSKYGLETSPKLVDIIAAVPSQYKKVLVPKLRAKPVRTASGIAVVAVMCKPHRFLI